MRSELAEQHEKLVRQKDQLEQWSARRQEEIQQQAAAGHVAEADDQVDGHDHRRQPRRRAQR